MRARTMAARRKLLRRLIVPFFAGVGVWEVTLAVLGGGAAFLVIGLLMLTSAVLLYAASHGLAPGPADRDRQRRAP